jgi:3',5'-cyclic-nucleotide phosphodiesterase
VAPDGASKNIGPSQAIHQDIDASVEPGKWLHCLDAGAMDVLTSPLQHSRVKGLPALAYRAYKETCQERTAFLATKSLRKRSWVGFEERKPFAYLREDMVSGLMMGICNPDNILHVFDYRTLPRLERGKESAMSKAIASWNFSAHEYSEDELVHIAFLMLQHALTMPELEKWRLPADELKTFLMASRAAYNAFVCYHNFRHVVDVLQAVFFFLVQLGTLPPYPAGSVPCEIGEGPSIAALLRPFDALTLLISAIGHDVGHPGVNNAFLVALGAPLAQLYNDKSVLEAFHCAAYSQILRRYWKPAFEDVAMRSLMINTILATDMGVHFKYMTDLGNLQAKVLHDQGTAGWSQQTLDEYRTLTCGLLIKCADISNVARPFEIAAKWSDILQLEFANQGVMEQAVGIPTTLFGGPPELGNLTKLANSQIGFMNIFAGPLFEAVTDILPPMVFAVEEIKKNQGIWKRKVENEKAKNTSEKSRGARASEGLPSPRSGSPNRSPLKLERSHPEGLPASLSSTRIPKVSALSQSLDTPQQVRKGSAGSFGHLFGVPQPGSVSSSPDVSRRSSLGFPFGYSSPPHDSISFSRRSSVSCI